MSGVRVTAHGLVKAYRDGDRVVEVLRGADLEAESGELIAVVGPSGSGKSTLLHLLGGLDRPDAGDITVGDVQVTDLPPPRLAPFRNRTVGFVFQFQELLADFTAYENVILPGRIRGLSEAVVAERARDLLTRVGLAERTEHFPSQLSGGERQRVALCRALLLEPPLLLADEPTGNLDEASGERVFELLVELQASHGTTSIVVTHNPALARRCARVLRLEGGLLGPG